MSVADTHFTSLSKTHINDAVGEATRRVNHAVQDTRRSIYGVRQSAGGGAPTGNQSSAATNTRTASDLMRMVRYPPSQAIGLASSAEIFEQTLETLLAEVNAGYQYSINESKGEF